MKFRLTVNIMQTIKDLIKQLVIILLIKEAALVLRRYQPKVVAVTGSVGKTSTKDAIYNVLSSERRSRKSEKSYNSEFGVPLTILGQKSAWMNPFGWAKVLFMGATEVFFPAKYPELLVLEVGADRPGDIKKMMKWLKPDIGILTRLPDIPVHIEFFPDRESIVREKIALAQGVKKDGLIIYNRDDETLHQRIQILDQKKLTYGFSDEAEVRGSNIMILYDKTEDGKTPIGISFKVEYKGQTIPIRVHSVLGRHQIYSVLAAIAVAVAEGLNIIAVAEIIQNSHETPPGRLKLIAGIKGATILDDTYNSSPAALESALQALAELETLGRKIAVLGDMLELGEYTIDAHRTAGRLVAETCDLLYTVGLRSKFIEEGAKEAGLAEPAILHFDSAREAGQALDKILQAGDVVLIKGSQGMRLEQAVEEIMAEPLRAKELLCRQEAEWLRR